MQENENNIISLESDFRDEAQHIMVVTLKGKIIDQTTSQQLVNQITEKISADRNLLIVNLGSVEYINSNGLNSLISILTKTRTRGGEVVLCCINEKIQKLLLITKLNSVFNICESEDEAIIKLNSFKQN